MTDFERKLAELINSFSIENGSDTPDFILAQYLLGCLENFDRTVRRRNKWYGSNTEIGTEGETDD